MYLWLLYLLIACCCELAQKYMMVIVDLIQFESWEFIFVYFPEELTDRVLQIEHGLPTEDDFIRNRSSWLFNISRYGLREGLDRTSAFRRRRHHEFQEPMGGEHLRQRTRSCGGYPKGDMSQHKHTLKSMEMVVEKHSGHHGVTALLLRWWWRTSVLEKNKYSKLSFQQKDKQTVF